MFNAAVLLARLLLSFIFLSSGMAALGDIAATAAYFAGLGLPFQTVAAWVVGMFELIVGSLLLIGLQTSLAALLLAAFSLAAGVIGHYGQDGADPAMAFMHSQALMKDVAIAGGLLALAAAGAGSWSIDGRI